MSGDNKEYIVTFDPLDGSSIVGCNWTVGSIFGIWKNDEKKLIGHKIGE
jgi:sedoheptulose-bisphosphatase